MSDAVAAREVENTCGGTLHAILALNRNDRRIRH